MWRWERKNNPKRVTMRSYDIMSSGEHFKQGKTHQFKQRAGRAAGQVYVETAEEPQPEHGLVVVQHTTWPRKDGL